MASWIRPEWPSLQSHAGNYCCFDMGVSQSVDWLTSDMTILSNESPLLPEQYLDKIVKIREAHEIMTV